MTHQDQGRNGSVCSHAYDLHKALRWLMVGVSLSGITFRPDCTWTPETLVFASLLWAWSDEKTLIERFTTARKIIINRYAEQQEPAGSYQAFIKMLCKWTDPLRQALSTAFRQRMAQMLAAVWMVEGWLVFAADGSRVDVPHTRKNEERYSPQIQAVAQGAEASSPAPTATDCTGGPRTQGQHAPDLAHDVVARGFGTSVGLANRPFRQQ